MKIAYLVVAHKNPLLLQREIRFLSSETTDFFIHIDRKSDIRPFLCLKAPNVFFTDQRLTIQWAGFSVIRAVLKLIEAALCGPQAYDYLVLLGGSEYPLRSRSYIHSFLSAHQGSEFIDSVPLPNQLAGKPLSHVTKYCLESPVRFLRRAVGLISRFDMFKRDYRKQLKGLEPYGGEMWWALTRDACEHIVEFTRSRPDVVKFFQNAQVPDETFIHTILGNSIFGKRIRKNLLYRDWSVGGSHPATMTEHHAALFESMNEVMQDDVFGRGEALFARKYNDDNLRLLDRIDAMIVSKDRSETSPDTIRTERCPAGRCA